MTAPFAITSRPDQTCNADQPPVESGRKSRPEFRVLLIYSQLGVGGAETWLIALLRYLKQDDCNLRVKLTIHICLTSGQKGDFDDEAKSLGATLFYLPYTRKKILTFAWRFRMLLWRGKYHAIHDHQDYTAGIRFLFGVGVLPPVRVVHVHNPAQTIVFLGNSFVRRQTLMAGKRLVGLFATHVLGTSRQILTEYGFDDPSYRNVKKASLNCGFNTENFRGDRETYHRELCHEFGWPEKSKIMLFVGRLSSNYNQKNPAFAIEVAKACRIQNESVRLLMAGGGDEIIEDLRQWIKSLGLNEEVLLIGERNDIPKLMLGANLFLFPSIAEGLGMVAVEAQAAGLPVLASDSIPRECMVVPSLVRFEPLGLGPVHWAQQALHMLEYSSADAESHNRAVRNSTFSIQNSASALISIYAGAEACASSLSNGDAPS